MNAQTLFLYAARHHQAGDLAKAIAMYRQVLSSDPSQGEAALYLALALQQHGDLTEAEAAYATAVQLTPNDVEALNGLATIYLELGKIREAGQTHLKALKVNPLSAAAYDGLGNVFQAQGDHDTAIDYFHRALELAPGTPDTLNNLGIALRSAGRPREATQRLEEAQALDPNSTDTLYNLGNAWQERGDIHKAKQSFMAAQKIDPWAIAPQWGACFANLDMLYDTEADVDTARKAYDQALKTLDNTLTLDSPEHIREAAAMVGANQPFYLTYQGKNDRRLQERYGNLVHRIMTAAYPQFTSPNFTKRNSGRIRVGIATGFMHEHSVWKIPTRGWVSQLDRKAFKVFGYYTGVKDDHCTSEARELFDKLTHEPHHFEELCQTILDDALDILIYPDIGMDPTCAKLAGLRLAPVQCVSLGHPMTTGLPTMDYFLSSELMEPEDGDTAYTETLVRLPNLSVYYSPLRGGKPAFEKSHFSLPEDKVLYFCPQSLYKYLPQYDRLYPLIAVRCPAAHFVFLENGRADILNQRFHARLSRAFADEGLEMADHVTMLPHQPAEAYHALNCLCDVFLDSIEWSGFNTAMEAANTSLPLVIYPKGHMRGRHSLAVVTMLDLQEVVAHSFDQYVQLAARMGNDSAFRQTIRQKTTANRARLFSDPAAIRGLEDWIRHAVR